MLEYLLERFLYRLSVHPLGGQHFVLKGGLLLAQFGARRITRDIDILGRAFPGDEQEIIHRITQIAATKVDDGVRFEPDTLATADPAGRRIPRPAFRHGCDAAARA